MTETTIVSQQSYLPETGQTSLNARVEGIKGKLTNAFKAKLDIMFELEEIRWSAEWLDDEIWKEWDAEYQAKGRDRAPRSWTKWVSLRGIQGDDMKLEESNNYNRWLATAVLYRLIEGHNSLCIIHNESVLPLPTSVYQVDAMLTLFRRADSIPSLLAEHEDSTGRGVLPPYLPPEEQTHLIEYWETAWHQSPRQYRVQKSESEAPIPVPPSRETVRKALESLELKAPPVEREQRIIDVTPPSPTETKKRDEIWEGIKARQQHDSTYDSAQQQRIQQQAKEHEAMQEQRSKLFRYNELLVALKRDVNSLETFVTEIDRTLGTQYFAELRGMKVGLISVSDDMERLRETAGLLMDVCRKLSTSNPPSGINIKTVDVDA